MPAVSSSLNQTSLLFWSPSNVCAHDNAVVTLLLAFTPFHPHLPTTLILVFQLFFSHSSSRTPIFHLSCFSISQAVISHVAVTHPVARHDVFACAISLLVIEPTKEEMEAKHHQIKGALFMLCCKAVARLVMQHPRYAKQLASQLLVLEGNDRPSVQTQINHLFGYLSQENRSTSLEVMAHMPCLTQIAHKRVVCFCSFLSA